MIDFDAGTDRIRVAAEGGATIAVLDDPRASFEGYARDTTWNIAQAGYFRAYATWTYLLEPYLFTYPGVTAEEACLWVEGDQAWRTLDVTFPESMHTHSRTQRYYFEPTGRLRRIDYQPAVNGGSPAAHYVRAEAAVDGVVMPTSRHIHVRGPNGDPDFSVSTITMDFDSIEFDLPTTGRPYR